MEPAPLRLHPRFPDAMITPRWLALLALGCARPDPVGSPPPLVLGKFEDDYGSRYVISERVWAHGAGAKYHIVRWHPERQYLVAQNDRRNPTEPGLWTRIDWLAIPGIPPFAWAFCMSAYAAPDPDSAESIDVARRDMPRTGCNGFPFSRMKRPSP